MIIEFINLEVYMKDTLRFFNDWNKLDNLRTELEIAEEFNLMLVNKMMSDSHYKDFLLETENRSIRYKELSIIQEKLDELHEVIAELKCLIYDKEMEEDENDNRANKLMNSFCYSLGY